MWFIAGMWALGLLGIVALWLFVDLSPRDAAPSNERPTDIIAVPATPEATTASPAASPQASPTPPAPESP